MNCLYNISAVRAFPMLLLWGILFYLGSLLPSIGFAQTPVTLWSEGWEGNWVVNWHVDAGTWEVGIPTSGPNSAHNGQKCAATVLAGDYSEPVDSRLIRHTSFIVPSASDNPRLRFWHWYSFSTADSGFAQIKIGSGQWQTIGGPYVNTGSGVWTYPSIDLSMYADSTVQLAFYFHSQQDWLDPDVSTGWYIDDIAIITGPVALNNPEGWESGIGDWGVDLGTWEVGTPTSGPGGAYSGQKCAATVLAGDYSEPVDSRLVSPPFVVVSASQNPNLRLWHWYSFSTLDTGFVQVRILKHEWETLGFITGTSSGVWTIPFYDLTPYADSTVQIAFYFHSQQDWLDPDVSTGWYIDEISIDAATGLDENKSNGLPRVFSLKQNYPNPFNPSTTIRYQLPMQSHVTLKVSDLLGREVVTLVNSVEEPGYKSVSFNSSGLASGVYFYRLQAGSFIETKKLILLR